MQVFCLTCVRLCGPMSIEQDLEEFNNLFKNLTINKMNQQQITELIVSAVGAAISAKKTEFEAKLSQITGKLEGLEVQHIEEYKEITINNSIRCAESLDLVKTLPAF